MQTNINSLQIDISQQFEALLTKVNSQKVLMAELEDKMQKVNNIESFNQDCCILIEVKVYLIGFQLYKCTFDHLDWGHHGGIWFKPARLKG